MPAPRRPRPVAGGSPRLLNVEPSPPGEIWDAHAKGPLRDEDPPAAVDLTAGRAWYRIRDQGETGSCVGWALGDSVMRWHLVENGRLTPRQSLSTRFLWMASKEWQAQRVALAHSELGALLREWQPSTFLEEAATTAKDGLEVARLLGAVPEPVLRWSGPLNRGPEHIFYSRAAQYRIAGYYDVSATGHDATMRRFRQWLHQQGPILLVVESDRELFAGEHVLRSFRARKRVDLHACALVGYTDAGFLLRNSWGQRWGRRGYAIATPEWLRRGARESYGVVFPP